MKPQEGHPRHNTIAVSHLPDDGTYRAGDGPVGVLLIHGLCGTPSEMRFVANGLARAGHTVLCPQLAGHGGTVDDLKKATWQDWRRSALNGLRELRRTCDKVIVGGLSTGALLALLLAADQPDNVDGVVLLAPTLWVNGWNVPWYARLFKIIRNKKLANLFDHPDHYPHGIKDDRIRSFFTEALFGKLDASVGLPYCPGGAVLEHRLLSKEVRTKLASIKQHTLILHPREDDLADMSNAFYLQRNLGGMVEMVTLHDSYHNVTIDRQRHVVVERATEFVARLMNKSGAPSWKQSTPERKKANRPSSAPTLQPEAALA